MGIYCNQGIISPPWSVVQATKVDTNPVLAKLALNVFLWNCCSVWNYYNHAYMT
jgi:hypothetical protein